MIVITIIALFCFIIFNGDVNALTEKNLNRNTAKNLGNLLDNLIVAFDCSKPKNITSHSYQELEPFEDEEVNIETKEYKMQILQKSNSYIIKAKTCSIRRTIKSTYCGNADHETALE